MISVQIKKRLGDFALDVGFEAPRGVTAIFGRSGSGKTSVINAIAGLMRPDAGRIVVDGRDLTAVPVHKRNLGVVFQDARLFPHMTVAKNLAYGGAHDSDKIVELLGLGALMNRFPKALSGGEKSRVALGRALMSKPALLLLHEPLAALDAPRKTEILSYLE
ncbi:MAG: ATP-binding cassette domain-containing protein, partial [Loktanella sp.]|nr:ATP-binding cassette domain-containing protein [Loktanella sp.]